MDLVRRENELIEILKYLGEKRFDFIVVGGYAVSSLTKHRFSADCDIVIAKKQLQEFEDALKKKGYKKTIEKGEFDQIYGGHFIRYKKKIKKLPISIDLLVNSLVCRTTGAAWSFEYIKKQSIMMNVPGIETSVRCRVPKRDLLIAFKIHSGRRTDIRDTIMLQEKFDLNLIMNHLRRGNIDVLKNQLNNIMFALEDKNLVNSLKGVFTLKGDVERQITSTKKNIEQIFKLL